MRKNKKKKLLTKPIADTPAAHLRGVVVVAENWMTDINYSNYGHVISL